ncbi:hypothetical protein PanWU01x14_360760 [Parasponia andersonii]|uniref:Uncharacterized protein n=1 Tax=Parasponia andersonii TaxID=3476 RepID=A0A2P5A7K2_PARAD|nr:hypothetical protein PanWU01x14_360760 [Parasponia andersonii]
MTLLDRSGEREYGTEPRLTVRCGDQGQGWKVADNDDERSGETPGICLSIILDDPATLAFV